MLVRDAAIKLGVSAPELIDWLRKRGLRIGGPSSPVASAALKGFRKRIAVERRTKGERRERPANPPPAGKPRTRERRKVKAPPLLAGRRVLVDGSNMAFAGGKQPRLRVLEAVVAALRAAGASVVEVICDATLRHKFREHAPTEVAAFEQAVDEGRFGQAPPGHPADEVLLVRLHAVPDALLASNDSFTKDERRFAPADLPARQIKLYASDDGVTLLLPAALGGGALTRPL